MGELLSLQYPEVPELEESERRVLISVGSEEEDDDDDDGGDADPNRSAPRPAGHGEHLRHAAMQANASASTSLASEQLASRTGHHAPDCLH